MNHKKRLAEIEKFHKDFRPYDPGTEYLINRVKALTEALEKIRDNTVPGGHDQWIAKKALEDKD